MLQCALSDCIGPDGREALASSVLEIAKNAIFVLYIYIILSCTVVDDVADVINAHFSFFPPD